MELFQHLMCHLFLNYQQFTFPHLTIVCQLHLDHQIYFLHEQGHLLRDPLQFQRNMVTQLLHKFQGRIGIVLLNHQCLSKYLIFQKVDILIK